MNGMRRAGAVMLVLGLLAAACGSDDVASPAAGLEVVASFYPLYEAAVDVGGEDANVTNLTPPGAEAHDLELTTSQLDAVIDADVVFYLGEGFQPALEEAVPQARGRAIDLLEGLDLHEGLDDEDEHADENEHPDEDEHGHGVDPHVWLDPQRLAQIVDRIESVFAEVAPDAAESFAARADVYRARLGDLDFDFETVLATCERHLIVTNHASFGYLADRYGLTQEAVSGLSPSEEPGPARLAQLADLVRSEGVTTVFTDVLASPRVAQTLAREAGVEVAVLDPIEGLSEERISEGTADYVSVMRENLAALQEALDCQ